MRSIELMRHDGTMTTTMQKQIGLRQCVEKNGLLCVFALSLLAGMGKAGATPDEIMVYTDEMNAPGRLGIEQHFNYTFKGRQTAEYAGQMPSEQLTQLTSEIAYGLAETLEAAVYLPFAVAANGEAVINGFRLRLKYIAPHPLDDLFFYGLNFETGQSSIRVSETRNAMELRPIMGLHNANWLASFNPILNFSLDGDARQSPRFEPAFKLTHRVGEGVNAGLEYYGEWGALNALQTMDQTVTTVYAVMDVESHGIDTNLGIGHGFFNATDQWIVKGVATLPF